MIVCILPPDSGGKIHTITRDLGDGDARSGRAQPSHPRTVAPSAITVGQPSPARASMNKMSRHESATTPEATLTKASTSGRTSSARRATHSAVTGTPREGTNTMPGHVRQFQYRSGRQRVTSRQHEHPRLSRHVLHKNPLGINRRPQQGHVAAVVEQPCGRLGQVVADQAQRDLRVRLLERGQYPGPPRTARGRLQPHGQLPGHRASRVPGRRHAPVQASQGLQGKAQERRTGRGERPAATPRSRPAQSRPRLPAAGSAWTGPAGPRARAGRRR
jgi:hypothetical protein